MNRFIQILSAWRQRLAAIFSTQARRSMFGGLLALGALLLFSFQNCSPGFELKNLSDSSSSAGQGDQTGGGTGLPPEPTVDPNGPLQVYSRNARTQQGGTLAFKIEINRAHTEPITVVVATHTSATAPAIEGTDFEKTEVSVTIPAGQLSATVPVQTWARQISSSAKSLTLDIASTSAGQIGKAQGAGLIDPLTQALPYAFKSMSLGNAHSCGLTAVGTVFCWGSGSEGQLGNNSLLQSVTPVEVMGLTGIKSIATGTNSNCAITATDTLKCWGYNSLGQLGNGVPAISVRVPVDAIGLSGIKFVAVGGGHACAITTIDTVKCWGGNNVGQLGNGTLVTSVAPTDVPGLVGIKALALGSSHSCALTAQNTVKCWGDNSQGSLGSGSLVNSSLPIDVVGLTGVKKIAAGYSNTCAITATDSVRCWGSNGFGEAGIGATTPITVTTPAAVLNITGVVDLALNTSQACALTGVGTVYCWGRHFYGGFGLNTESNVSVPTQVPGITAAKSIYGSAAGHTCTLSATGVPTCWGANLSGQSTATNPAAFAIRPQDVPGLTGVKSITQSVQQICALTGIDTVKCWGINRDANLGDGTLVWKQVPTDVFGLTGIKAIASGSMARHSCALTAANTVRCWGRNDFGEIGIAGSAIVATPTDIASLGTVKAVAVAGSLGRTCAITATDTVRCLGFGLNGELGNNSLNSSSTPVDAMGVTGAVSLALGDSHSCVLLATGNVRCWGQNYVGQLGTGATSSLSARPVDVLNLTGIKAIAAGGNHSCAITATNTVKCWGLNSRGQLGNGTTLDSALAVDVQGLTGVTALALGRLHSCALLTDKTVKCWGANYAGQVSQNLMVQSALTPVDAGFSDVSQISAGGDRTAVIWSPSATKLTGLVRYIGATPTYQSIDTPVTPLLVAPAAL